MDPSAILARVDALITGSELQPEARAMLLVRLCQFAQFYSMERAKSYWELLKPLQGKIPSDLTEEYTKLKEVFEGKEKPASDFAAEMIAEIKEARQSPEESETIEKLKDCEVRLNKRFLPFGKGSAWAALVEAWIRVDCSYALNLIDKVPENQRKPYIIQANYASGLSLEEWSLLAKRFGKKMVAETVLQILEAGNANLNPPVEIIYEVGRLVQETIQKALSSDTLEKANQPFDLYEKLILLTPIEQANSLSKLFEEEFNLLVKDPAWKDSKKELDQFRFFSNLFRHLRAVKEKKYAFDMPAFVDGLTKKTPPALANFFQAEAAYWSIYTGEKELYLSPDGTSVSFLWKTVPDEEINAIYKNQILLKQYNANAETWFLVRLVQAGLGSKAFELAQHSPNKSILLCRLRRCWLVTDPVNAVQFLKPEEVEDDPISNFLIQGGPKERGAYLRSITQMGIGKMPRDLWIYADKPPKAKLLEALRTNTKTYLTPEQKHIYEMIQNNETMLEIATESYIIEHFIQQNSILGLTLKKETGDLFTRFLSYSGYGFFFYKDIDPLIREALSSWGDEHPDEVKMLALSMLKDITPSDSMLRVDLLRNAIFERCRTVLAADPDTLVHHFVDWFWEKLVKNHLFWVEANTQYTLRFPDDMPLRFCTIAASAVQVASSQRCDQILMAGLQKFPKTAETVRLTAEVYSANKARLDFAPPVSLPNDLVAAWQMGIIQTALVEIINALAAAPKQEA